MCKQKAHNKKTAESDAVKRKKVLIMKKRRIVIFVLAAVVIVATVCMAGCVAGDGEDAGGVAIAGSTSVQRSL